MVDPARAAGELPDEVASLVALHEVVVALAAPVTPEPEAVQTLFATIVRGACDAVGASFARLVLAEAPEWRALLGSAATPSEPVPPIEGGYEERPRVTLHVQRGEDVHIRWRRQRRNGPVLRALTTGRTVFVPDMRTDTEYGPYPPAQWEVGTFVVAPLVLMGATLGALCVAFREVVPPERWSSRTLDLFAAHAACTVERVRRLYDERRRARQAERMASSLAQIGAATTLEEGLEALVRGAIDLLGGVCGTARVRDPETGERLISVSVERDGRLAVRRPAGAPRPGSYAAALENGGPSLLIEDFWALDERVYPYYAEMRRAGLRSGVNVPIEARGRRIGSLHFDHPSPGYFTKLDVSLAETLAAYAGQAVLRLRLEEERGQRARLDGAMLVARTVAHEINNALSPVVGYSELLGLRPAVMGDSQAATYVSLIGQAAADATAKVARLQRIVRLQEEPSPLGPTRPILDMDRSTGS